MLLGASCLSADLSGFPDWGLFCANVNRETTSVLEFISSVHVWDKELGIESILSPISLMQS